MLFSLNFSIICFEKITSQNREILIFMQVTVNNGEKKHTCHSMKKHEQLDFSNKCYADLKIIQTAITM